MKNALILHGMANNHTGNWFPWLKKELEKQGYKVWVPDLPNADMPEKNAWLNTVFSNKEWVFDKDSVIIGHSAGSTLILRILEELPENVKINKAVLVAGFTNLSTNPEWFSFRRSLAGEPFKWDKIKKSCEHFYFVCSDNDRYQCGVDQAKIMQEHLGGEVILKKGQDHFNLEKGPQYKKFPELLKLI